jgi:hypothetical protein
MSKETTDLPECNAETYIGDGVYVSFDGWQVWLRAPREEGDHRIALEPEVYQSLHQWLRRYPRLAGHMERLT